MYRIILIVLIILIAAYATVQAQNTTRKISKPVSEGAIDSRETSAQAVQEEMLGPDRWPTTLDASVKDIIAALSEEDRATLRETKREDLIKLHHGWCTGIRNHYGLWRWNNNLIESVCGKPCHPDDASMIIIEKVWEALQH